VQQAVGMRPRTAWAAQQTRVMEYMDRGMNLLGEEWKGLLPLW
jgi:hypothetical protein